MHHRRIILLLTAAAFLIVACSGGGPVAPTVPVAPTGKEVSRFESAPTGHRLRRACSMQRPLPPVANQGAFDTPLAVHVATDSPVRLLVAYGRPFTGNYRNRYYAGELFRYYAAIEEDKAAERWSAAKPLIVSSAPVCVVDWSASDATYLGVRYTPPTSLASGAKGTISTYVSQSGTPTTIEAVETTGTPRVGGEFVITDNAGRTHFFYRVGGELRVTWQVTTAAEGIARGWVSRARTIASNLGSGVAVGTDAGGILRVLYVADDRSLWALAQKGPGGPWGTAYKLSNGPIRGVPRIGELGDRRLLAFYQLDDTSLVRTRLYNEGWRNEQELPFSYGGAESLGEPTREYDGRIFLAFISHDYTDNGTSYPKEVHVAYELNLAQANTWSGPLRPLASDGGPAIEGGQHAAHAVVASGLRDDGRLSIFFVAADAGYESNGAPRSVPLTGGAQFAEVRQRAVAGGHSGTSEEDWMYPLILLDLPTGIARPEQDVIATPNPAGGTVSPSTEPTNTSVSPRTEGTFSCSGTIKINNQDCAAELGTATTCVCQGGSCACPAIRDGCTCSCSAGPCH